MNLVYHLLAFFVIPAQCQDATTPPTNLNETFIRFSHRFWAESLFGSAAYVIGQNETAEAIIEARKKKEKPAVKRFRPFRGEVEAFELGDNDLGFVRDAFDFDGDEKNLTVALRATASRVGPPDVLLALRTAKRLAIGETENFIKIKDGRVKCFGFANATDVEETTTTTTVTAIYSDETTPAAIKEAASTKAPSQGATTPSDDRSEITPPEIMIEDDNTTGSQHRQLQAQEEGDDEEEPVAIWDLSNLEKEQQVEVIIIDHVPAKLIYGSENITADDAEGLEKDKWTGRRKLRCFCALDETEPEKLKKADETFRILRISLDCDDLQAEEAQKQNAFLSMAPASAGRRSSTSTTTTTTTTFSRRTPPPPAAPHRRALPPQPPLNQPPMFLRTLGETVWNFFAGVWS